MKENIRLIVLSHTKFGDNSIILHTLSEVYGRRSFMVRIGKKTSTGAFLPLSIVEAEIVENPKSTLWTARGFSSVHPLSGIRNNIYKNTITLFMSEVLFRVVKDGVIEDGLYEWCEKNILTLNDLQQDWSNFPIRFLLELAVALGFSPSWTDLAPFAGEHLETLRLFVESSFSESMLIPLSGETRNALSEHLLRYLEYHTESTLNIRSLPVLRELYR